MKTLDEALAGLNPAQAAAATARGGPLAIVAGPGTGKTKTLTARLAYLIGRGQVPPARILALTFTNKAAREMQVRSAALLSGQPKHAHALAAVAPAPHITTFHGLCYELLRIAGHGKLQIISEPERMELLRGLRRRGVAGLPLRELAGRISRLKNLPAGQKAQPIDAETAELLHAYNAALHRRELCDFDDLLQRTHEMLIGDSDFRSTTQTRWQYILVDEFQDTNELQYQLLRLLAAHDNYFVIGDPLQSIYGFRGAAGDVFARFASDFPHVRRFTLTTNYRSAEPVVAVANTVFASAPQLTAASNAAGRAEVVQTLNEYREASWIVQTIEQDLGGTDFLRSHQVHTTVGQASAESRTFADYAVLYRTHRVAQALKRAFASSGLPYQCVGEESPYSHKALRTAIAAMCAVVAPAELSPSGARLLKPFARKTLAEVAPAVASLPSTRFLAHVADRLRLFGEDDVSARRGFNQALAGLVRFDGLEPRDFLAAYFELSEQDYYDPRADAVTLLTIHAAKGLEFGHVFLVAAEDGVLPHSPPARRDKPAASTPELTAARLAEEQRLFYVAVTRAREHLTILHASTRGGQPARVSPFVQAIDPQLLAHRRDADFAAQVRAQTRRAYKNAQIGLF